MICYICWYLLIRKITGRCLSPLFTSPTSALDINSENDVEDQAPPARKRAQSHKAPTHGNVANLLGMRSVTPRAIAYVAVQVTASPLTLTTLLITLQQLCFALSSATTWNKNDGCFNYPTFYNSIVDFFEAPPGPVSQAQAQAFLLWWTGWVLHQFAITHADAAIFQVAKSLENIMFHCSTRLM